MNSEQDRVGEMMQTKPHYSVAMVHTKTVMLSYFVEFSNEELFDQCTRSFILTTAHQILCFMEDGDGSQESL